MPLASPIRTTRPQIKRQHPTRYLPIWASLLCRGVSFLQLPVSCGQFYQVPFLPVATTIWPRPLTAIVPEYNIFKRSPRVVAFSYRVSGSLFTGSDSPVKAASLTASCFASQTYISRNQITGFDNNQIPRNKLSGRNSFAHAVPDDDCCLARLIFQCLQRFFRSVLLDKT